MKHSFISVFTIILLFSAHVSTAAQAGSLRFGKDSQVIKLQDIKMKGPNGEQLYLGYLLETDYFVLGTGVQDKGYVIGIKGQDDGFYRIPDAQKVQIAKNTGLLPREFPLYTISPLQYAIGYSLWLSIAILCLWMMIGRMSRKPQRL
jgi:hypothetical protein